MLPSYRDQLIDSQCNLFDCYLYICDIGFYMGSREFHVFHLNEIFSSLGKVSDAVKSAESCVPSYSQQIEKLNLFQAVLSH